MGRSSRSEINPTAQAPEASKEVIRALAEQVVRRNLYLEMELLDHMQAAMCSQSQGLYGLRI